MNLDLNTPNIFVKFKNKSGSVELTVQRNGESIYEGNELLKWKVWWIVKTKHGVRKGEDLWTDRNIKLAFDLNGDPPSSLICLGIFVKKGRYVNIPSQGSGQDDDSNVSIFINDEIRNAIEEILMEKYKCVI